MAIVSITSNTIAVTSISSNSVATYLGPVRLIDLP
jgi:hypothetical protein